jgi:hypothetical protein
VIDTDLLAELAAGRVDAIITEDRGLHAKAAAVGWDASVFTIDSFLEKVTAENPGLADYKVLSVRRDFFGNIDLRDPFFDSFRADYPGFDDWFNRKSDEIAYVCHSDAGQVVAFLYVKVEGRDEYYGDITPPLAPARRLKIGTLKVAANGFKLGERFLKIVFDNAVRNRVQEIYVTAFRRSTAHDRLISLLEDWGFERHGIKPQPRDSPEEVFVRDFTPRANITDPRKSFPFVSSQTTQFIGAIRPVYHTELLPDSILKTEDPTNFVDDKPNRNALSKVFISRSHERNLKPGDLIVFYRTAQGGPAHHTSVATTVGVVQDLVGDIRDKQTFVRLCRKRSVFTDEQLAAEWDRMPRARPFVVNFLHVQSFPRRPNLGELKAEGIIAEHPRGFDRLAPGAFKRLLEISNADQRLIVD